MPRNPYTSPVNAASIAGIILFFAVIGAPEILIGVAGVFVASTLYQCLANK